PFDIAQYVMWQKCNTRCRLGRGRWCDIFATHYSFCGYLEAAHIQDGKLANQFAVPRELKPKSVDDFLGHEVMPDIPTDAPVQCFGHDVINPKIHAVRFVLLERCGALPPSLHGGRALLRRGWLRDCVGGYGGISHRGIAPRHHRASVAGLISPRYGCPRGGPPSCILRAELSLCRTAGAWRRPARLCRPCAFLPPAPWRICAVRCGSRARQRTGRLG